MRTTVMVALGKCLERRGIDPLPPCSVVLSQLALRSSLVHNAVCLLGSIYEIALPRHHLIAPEHAAPPDGALRVLIVPVPAVHCSSWFLIIGSPMQLRKVGLDSDDGTCNALPGWAITLNPITGDQDPDCIRHPTAGHAGKLHFFPSALHLWPLHAASLLQEQV